MLRDEFKRQNSHLHKDTANQAYMAKDKKSKGNIDPSTESKKKERKNKKYKEPHLSCTYCHQTGHNDVKCWKLHPELEPPEFKKKRLNYESSGRCEFVQAIALPNPYCHEC